MQELKIFNNKEFGDIRTLEENGKLWFCGVDIARALGYKDTNKAIKQHCREDGVVLRPVMDSLGRKQMANFVTEGNLYRMISGSELPSAERFDKWVYDEVLPALRKNGTYTVDTTCQYPISPAAIESATSAGRLLERLMKGQGIPPHMIMMAVRSVFQQAGVDLPEYVVKIPEYEQLTISSLDY